MTQDETTLVELLRDLLYPVFEVKVQIEDLKRITTGASRETWSFNVLPAAGPPIELVFQRDFPDGSTPTASATDDGVKYITRGDEFQLMQQLHQAPPRPAFEYALHWLRKQLHRFNGRTTLVHGDYRNGNFLIDEHGLCAILDWERASGSSPVPVTHVAKF